MARRKQGRRIKRKTQKQTDTDGSAHDPKVPRLFVFKKGKVPAPLKALVEDLKRVMSPNTARALRARKRNRLRDFVAVAGALHVSFFIIVSATDKATYLRLVRAPHGPTLTFRVESYTLASDVAAAQRRPYSAGEGLWQCAPLPILSNFNPELLHQKLASTLLRNAFPTIDPAELKIATCRRVALFHQQPEDDGGALEMRHYAIKAAPTGVSRGVKKLLRGAKLPSLGRYADVAEYMQRGGGYSSDSGAETDDEERVQLPQDFVGRGTTRGQQVGIKLHEMGPRLRLSLVKVEEGLCDGAVLYHAHVAKTEEEAAAVAARREERARLKEERKEAQKANVAAKKKAGDEKLGARRKRRRLGLAAREDGDGEDGGDDDQPDPDDYPDVDDGEWDG